MNQNSLHKRTERRCFVLLCVVCKSIKSFDSAKIKKSLTDPVVIASANQEKYKTVLCASSEGVNNRVESPRRVMRKKHRPH